jgi:predicted DCC family thiol-disulfide oxidoreductase YuxK
VLAAEGGGVGRDGNSRFKIQDSRFKMEDKEETSIIYDGSCSLCNSAVRFLKPAGEGISFIPADTSESELLLGKYDIPRGLTVQSVILIDRNKVYTKSTAVIKALQKKGGFWIAAWIFRLVPVCIRDAVYDWVAENRRL